MSATLFYRIGSVLLILFALGHTFGFLKFKPPTTEGRAVRESMDKVSFQVRGTTFSFGRFYVGFGLSITAYLLFTAFLSWHLGGLAVRSPEAIGALGWMFFALQVVLLVLSWAYFSAGPALFSGVSVLILGIAAWLAR